jgi:HAMP domain-containing protein
MPDDDDSTWSWWTIPTDVLLDALRQVAAGDDPDVVLAELYANSEHEDYADDDEGS